MLVRVILVSGLALLAALQVARTAIVSANVDRQPALAERVWPGQPQIDFALAMAEIGRAAASGETVVPATALSRAERGSAAAPLAVEPFLIMGTLAKAEQREALAERLFVEARTRDPRSAAARYFLAERYLSSGRAEEGVNEVSALVRLVPGGPQVVVPGLAEYARVPGAVRPLRRMFGTYPEIGQAVLAQLASDPANADLIMQIAEPTKIEGSDAPAAAWQGKLLNALIERGEFARAQKLWMRISGIRSTSPPGVINQAFAKITAPPPFNWTFGSGSSGVAESTGGGKLNVIFYGRENASLASQLLVLPPGRYRIQMEASGDNEGDSGLDWSITCLPGEARLTSIPLKGATLAGVRLGGEFIVPAQSCAAQWLKLNGTAKDIAKSEQVMIGKFELSAVSGR